MTIPQTPIPEPVLCENCQHCNTGPKGVSWRLYTCLMSPKRSVAQYVVRDRWLTEPPHKPCWQVNQDGDCKMFEEKRVAKTQPEDTED